MRNKRVTKKCIFYPDRGEKELFTLSTQLKTEVKAQHYEVKESSAIHTNRPEFYLECFVWFLGALSFGSALFGQRVYSSFSPFFPVRNHLYN